MDFASIEFEASILRVWDDNAQHMTGSGRRMATPVCGCRKGKLWEVFRDHRKQNPSGSNPMRYLIESQTGYHGSFRCTDMLREVQALHVYRDDMTTVY
ncbi:hypothetical protein VCV18_012552 [Metarhizium anisopliae]